MAMILWGAIDAASDQTMATVTRRSGSEFRAALSDLLSQIAAGIIANDPAIIAAAEAAVDEALEDAGIVRFGDPAIPERGQFTDNPFHALREMDQMGRMTRAIYSGDGTQYMPLARVDTLKVAASGTMEGTPIGSGVSFAVTDADGHLSDLAIGEDGRFLPHVIDNISGRLGGGSDGLFGYDIIVCFGQSNAAESGDLKIPGLYGQDSRLFKWSSGAIVPLPSDDLWLGASFIREYARATARTGRRVLVVPAAVGSVGFSTTSIDPPPEGYVHQANGTLDRTLTADPKNRYAAMVTTSRAARSAAGEGSRIVAMLWSQGEADYSLSQSEYAAKLDDMIAQARADLGVGDLPFIMGSMTPGVFSDHDNLEPIARALADTPRRVYRSSFTWGPENAHRWYQTVHFNAASQLERAGRMAREGWQEACLNTEDNAPVNPMHMKVIRSGGTATLHWDRPLCHVSSMAVQFSTNGGSSWSAATIDTMHGSRATASVAAGTAVQFRITVTNAVGTTMPAVVAG